MRCRQRVLHTPSGLRTPHKCLPKLWLIHPPLSDSLASVLSSVVVCSILICAVWTHWRSWPKAKTQKMMNSESSSVNGSVVISHYVAVPLPRNALLFTELDSLFIIFCILALGQLLRVHLILIKPVSGCIHIGTSTSPGINDVVEYFSQSILSIRFNWRLSVDTRWFVLVQVTMNAHLHRWSLCKP